MEWVIFIGVVVLVLWLLVKRREARARAYMTAVARQVARRTPVIPEAPGSASSVLLDIGDSAEGAILLLDDAVAVRDLASGQFLWSTTWSTIDYFTAMPISGAAGQARSTRIMMSAGEYMIVAWPDAAAGELWLAELRRRGIQQRDAPGGGPDHGERST